MSAEREEVLRAGDRVEVLHRRGIAHVLLADPTRATAFTKCGRAVMLGVTRKADERARDCARCAGPEAEVPRMFASGDRVVFTSADPRVKHIVASTPQQGLTAIMFCARYGRSAGDLSEPGESARLCPVCVREEGIEQRAQRTYWQTQVALPGSQRTDWDDLPFGQKGQWRERARREGLVDDLADVMGRAMHAEVCCPMGPGTCDEPSAQEARYARAAAERLVELGVVTRGALDAHL